MKAGIQIPDIPSTFCRKQNYSTGMEDTNLGTSLVFTMTYGRAGLFLTLQGYLNSITATADIIWHFKNFLHKNVELCICSPISLFMNSTFDTHDPRRKPQRLMCANGTPVMQARTPQGRGQLRKSGWCAWAGLREGNEPVSVSATCLHSKQQLVFTIFKNF